MSKVKSCWKQCIGIVTMIAILFYYASLLIYYPYDDNQISNLTSKGMITFKKKDRNSLQIKLNQYIEYISNFDYESSSLKKGLNTIIDGVPFKPISKQFIIDTLSNKTIVLFGDSLQHFLTTYILQVIYWCIMDNVKHNSFKCTNFCDHLENDRSPLILPECAKWAFVHHGFRKQILDQFDDHHNNFGKNNRSSVYIAKYNITIHLYYYWGVHIRNARQMIRHSKEYNALNYDIMINNLLNQHWTLWEHKYMYMWKYDLAVPMLNKMEDYMHKLITHNDDNHKCLIFGPINPWFYGAAKYWLPIQTKILFSKCKYLDGIDFNNMNISDSDSVHKISKILSSPSILNCIESIRKNDDMDYDWNNHLNYSWNYIKDDNYSFDQLVDSCKRSIYRMYARKRPKHKRVTFESLGNEYFNLCLLYHQGLGQTIIAQRMKQFVTNLNYVNKKKKNRVYYHDQYTLYHNFDNLSDYIDGACHYPQLAPIAWTNLLNIIANGF